MPTARNVLFRFFDVEIEPGRTYRYRVKLTSLNPAFDDESVPREEVSMRFSEPIEDVCRRENRVPCVF